MCLSAWQTTMLSGQTLAVYLFGLYLYLYVRWRIAIMRIMIVSKCYSTSVLLCHVNHRQINRFVAA